MRPCFGVTRMSPVTRVNGIDQEKFRLENRISMSCCICLSFFHIRGSSSKHGGVELVGKQYVTWIVRMYIQYIIRHALLRNSKAALLKLLCIMSCPHRGPFQRPTDSDEFLLPSLMPPVRIEMIGMIGNGGCPTVL